MKQFKGKVALVTGASSGMGRAAAVLFAREGANVIVAARRAPESEETVRLIKEGGGEAIFIKADVSNAAEVEAMVEKAVETFGRLDCAFNNAGVNASTSTQLANESEEEFDRVLCINLKGVWLCMKYEIRQMIKQRGGGVIVNTSSVGGLRGVPAAAAYTASKFGVIGLTRNAAVQYAKAGIRINAICPGYTRGTEMMEHLLNNSPEMEGLMKQRIPMGKFGRPENIAETAVWLCSNAASYITGQAIVVDGGVLA
jgi:NAD(P)-dependent dehydrogenase (short-subunit alcohol dehydrogenase family)